MTDAVSVVPEKVPGCGWFVDVVQVDFDMKRIATTATRQSRYSLSVVGPTYVVSSTSATGLVIHIRNTRIYQVRQNKVVPLKFFAVFSATVRNFNFKLYAFIF